MKMTKKQMVDEILADGIITPMMGTLMLTPSFKRVRVLQAYREWKETGTVRYIGDTDKARQITVKRIKDGLDPAY